MRWKQSCYKTYRLVINDAEVGKNLYCRASNVASNCAAPGNKGSRTYRTNTSNTHTHTHTWSYTYTLPKKISPWELVDVFPLVLDGQEQPQFLVRPEAGVGVGIHIYIYKSFFLMSIGLQRHCLHIVHVGFSIGHGGKCFLNLTHLWNIKTEKTVSNRDLSYTCQLPRMCLFREIRWVSLRRNS